MEADAAVEAEDEEVQVVTQAEAGAQGDLFGKFLQREGSVGASCIGAEQPDVARIEEDGAVEVGDEVEAVFYIGFQADVAHVVDKAVLVSLSVGRGITTGADTAGGEGTDAVGTTDVELLGVGGGEHVAVGPDTASWLPATGYGRCGSCSGTRC